MAKQWMWSSNGFCQQWFHKQERLQRNSRAEYVNATKKGDFTSKNQDHFNINPVESFKI